jgi:hypothetical protein
MEELAEQAESIPTGGNVQPLVAVVASRLHITGMVMMET